MTMEHRWSERIDMSGRARLEFPGGVTADTWMCNLSLGGVGIMSRGLAACGTRVQVTLHFGERSGISQPCRLHGEVVHQTTGRLGIAFLDASPDAMRILRAVVNRLVQRSSHPEEVTPVGTVEAK